MRIAIVSDIHGNRAALAAVLADLRQVSPDLVIHGGDLAAGSNDADVVDQIRSLGWPGVVGNTDEMLWKPERLAQIGAQSPAIKKLLNALAHRIPVMRASLGDEQV